MHVLKFHNLSEANQSPSASNSQRGWSCEQIFDSSTTFLKPWSERSHCMKSGQSFFFSSLTRPTDVLDSYATLYLFLYSFWAKKKNRLFCSLPLHGKEKFSFLGLPTLITRFHFVNLTFFKIVSSLFSSSSEASTWLEILDTHAQLTQPAWAKGRVKCCHWTPHNIQNLVGKQN